jgi:hypothetical protein
MTRASDYGKLETKRINISQLLVNSTSKRIMTQSERQKVLESPEARFLSEFCDAY